jgi:hypothetical protein
MNPGFCSHARPKTDPCLDLTTMSDPNMVVRPKVLGSDTFIRPKTLERRMDYQTQGF